MTLARVDDAQIVFVDSLPVRQCCEESAQRRLPLKQTGLDTVLAEQKLRVRVKIHDPHVIGQNPAVFVNVLPAVDKHLAAGPNQIAAPTIVKGGPHPRVTTQELDGPLRVLLIGRAFEGRTRRSQERRCGDEKRHQGCVQSISVFGRLIARYPPRQQRCQQRRKHEREEKQEARVNTAFVGSEQ